MRALCLIREGLHYRRGAYLEGLKRAGYKPVDSLPDPKPGDLLLCWNRYGRFHTAACAFERAGGTVLITENGWLGKGWQGGEWFTLCRSHHSGAGYWPEGGPERWDSWGVDLHPWRTGTETIILAQRGIGEPGIASPSGWAERTQKRIGGRVRQHPGNQKANIEPDLKRAEKVVTWHSGGALKALAYGVPVWYEYPRWIGAGAASKIGDPLVTDDAKRLAMFRRLAWSMWTLDELRLGEPFVRIASQNADC
jgi:hypothetical protein